MKSNIYDIIFLLLFFTSLTIFSQNTKIDSLKSIVQTGVKDTAMVNTLIYLSQELINQGELEESLIYIEKAREFSAELSYRKGEALSLKWLGNVNYYKGNYVEVMDYWTKSVVIYEAIQDTIGISNTFSNLGIIYFSQGSNARAIDYLLRSLRLAEKLNNPLRISTALLNIAMVYGDSPQDWDKALNYYAQAYPYFKVINDPANSKAYYFGVGEIEYSKGNYQGALEYFEEGLEITKNTLYYSENLLLLGKTKFKLGEVEASLALLNECYSNAVKEDNLLVRVKCLIELGIVYQNNDFKKAISAYREAEDLAISQEFSFELAQIYDGISQSYVNNRDFKKGYEYQAKYLAQKDSIFNLETDDKLRGLQFNFDLEDKIKTETINKWKMQALEGELTTKRQKYMLYASLTLLGSIFLMGIAVVNRYKYIKKTNKVIAEEKNKSDTLLLNILPSETAAELKEYGKVNAEKFDLVTVMFTDFKKFTEYSNKMPPDVVVKNVNFYFSEFDRIIDKHGLEKIKTIGDAYMCASGLHKTSNDNVESVVKAGLEILDFMKNPNKAKDPDIVNFEIRIGINTGPVVAGVVGIKKFAYDIWGDTVNIASRMESNSEPGRINISENTYELIKDKYNCEYRGEIEVKNKGLMKMYFLNGFKS